MPSKLRPTSLTMSLRFRLLSPMTRPCIISTFSSMVVSLGRRPDRSSSSMPPSPPPKLSSPFLHCAIRRRFLPRGFHEVFMNFLGRYSFLTRVLYDCSNFLQFCQFDTTFSYLQRFPTVIKSFEILLLSAQKTYNKIKLSTDWVFVSVYWI